MARLAGGMALEELLLQSQGSPRMRLALPIVAATAGGEEGAVETFGQPNPLNPLCGAPC